MTDKKTRAEARAGDWLIVQGAAQHNLQHINLKLPKHTLIVFSGVSGSGKSSLAFDTLYAEGQRRYVESLSAYARQFLGQMDKPIYDRIAGLSPTIAIDQKSAGSNPRSTVGTITEIYDHQRVLFARVGQQRCHRCGDPIGAQEPAAIIADLQRLPEGTRLLVLAPVARGRKGGFTETFEAALRAGFVRARVDGEVLDLHPGMALNKKRRHDVELVVDRTMVRQDDTLRLTDSVETALRQAKGKVTVAVALRPGDDGAELPFVERQYSEDRHCERCDLSFPELSPALFSFNTPAGACPECNGLGIALQIDPSRVIPDPSLSVVQGAIVPWAKQVDGDSWTRRILNALAKREGIDLQTPWGSLPQRHREILLYGVDDKVKVKLDGKRGEGTWSMRYEGIIPQLKRRWRETSSDQMRAFYGQFFAERTCDACKGRRLRPEACAVVVGDKKIHELSKMPIGELATWVDHLSLEGSAAQIAAELLKEIRARLSFLVDVGLPYLTLDRAGQSLSGGESQRIRLASQVGAELSGVLYILDEPSIGLHPRDAAHLLRTLKHLRDLDNTVLMVEHDETIIRVADYIVDFGPGAGRRGGKIVAQGTLPELLNHPDSLTGAYLSGRRRIELPASRRTPSGWLKLSGATAHNLRDIDVALPLGCLSVITGVSGAGKSSLISKTLLPALAAQLKQGTDDEPTPLLHLRGLEGSHQLTKLIEINQKPIGRTPRSNPATYTQVWTSIREIFAALPDSRAAGYGPGRFSFNVKGGRCEHCKGDGLIKIEMHFLADVYVPCDVCGGKRFNEATLAIRYKGLTVQDVLNSTVDDAAEIFANFPKIARILQTLQQVGLGYLTLGQRAPTLSGGEAQRLKLAKELARPTAGHTLYVLDEPSTGLHFEDIRRLLDVLQTLVQRGHTVMVIEHNLDIIKVADHIIDLGPDGGDKGGLVVATGTPEELAACTRSYTGQALNELLLRGREAV